jgi:hypothetical protein
MRHFDEHNDTSSPAAFTAAKMDPNSIKCGHDIPRLCLFPTKVEKTIERALGQEVKDHVYWASSWSTSQTAILHPTRTKVQLDANSLFANSFISFKKSMCGER